MKKAIAVAFCALCLSGCAAAVVGGAVGVAAGFVYVKGSLRDVLDAPLPEAHEAARAAAVELDLTAVDGSVEGLKGTLRARMADGRRVWIHLEAVDFKATAVQIRVGKLGDQAVAQQILRHLRAHLGGS